MASEKKKFIPVQIPLLKREIELLAHSNEELESRYVKLDMTPELKGKNVEIKFIVRLKDGKPVAEPVEVYLISSFIGRIMRKNVDYVEDSFAGRCSDKNIMVKPFLITRKKVSRKIRAVLRNAARKEVIEYAKAKSFNDLVLDIISNRMQREISIKLKKIYPLGVCEIRFMKIITDKEYLNKMEKSRQLDSANDENLTEANEKKEKPKKARIEKEESEKE